MRNCKKIMAFMLSLLIISGAFSFSAGAEGSVSDELGTRLEIVSDGDFVYKPEIEFDTNYVVTVPHGSSEDEAYYASFRTKDNRMYFILNGKNISMPTESGLANIQILDTEYNPVLGIGVAQGYEHSNAYKLNPYSRYYIKFFSDDNSPLNGGEMTFNISTVSDPESDNFESTTYLEKGETYEGNIAVPQDVDCFSFTRYNQDEFKMVIEPDKGTVLFAELYTYDYDSKTAQLVTSATADESTTIVARNASSDEDGYYRLKISSVNGGTGNYRIRYNDLRLVSDTALNLYHMGYIDGYGEDTGTDYLEFTTADKDAYYHILVHNTGVQTGASPDEYLQAELMDADFNVIDRISIPYKSNNRIVAKLPPDSVYYVKISNGFSEDAEGGSYALHLMYDLDEDRGLKEYAFDMNPGEITSGHVETKNDKDWFKVTTGDSSKYILVIENKSEEVIIEHENGNWEIKSIRAEILDENGEELVTAIASGEYKCIKKVDLEPNATYYIKVYDPSGTIAEYDVMLAERLVLGDADLDEKVKIQDATLIQKFVAKLAEIKGKQLVTADVNGDGKVSVKDATAIQKYIAKVETGYDIGSFIF